MTNKNKRPKKNYQYRDLVSPSEFEQYLHDRENNKYEFEYDNDEFNLLEITAQKANNRKKGFLKLPSVQKWEIELRYLISKASTGDIQAGLMLYAELTKLKIKGIILEPNMEKAFQYILKNFQNPPDKPQLKDIKMMLKLPVKSGRPKELSPMEEKKLSWFIFYSELPLSQEGAYLEAAILWKIEPPTAQKIYECHHEKWQAYLTRNNIKPSNYAKISFPKD